MMSVLLKYVIIDRCIGIMFSSIENNFSQVEIPSNLFKCQSCFEAEPNEPGYYLCHIDELHYFAGESLCEMCYSCIVNDIDRPESGDDCNCTNCS